MQVTHSNLIILLFPHRAIIIQINFILNNININYFITLYLSKYIYNGLNSSLDCSTIQPVLDWRTSTNGSLSYFILRIRESAERIPRGERRKQCSPSTPRSSTFVLRRQADRIQIDDDEGKKKHGWNVPGPISCGEASGEGAAGRRICSRYRGY